MTFERLREVAIGSGAVSADGLDRLDRLMSSDGFHALSNTLFLARGRKPAA